MPASKGFIATAMPDYLMHTNSVLNFHYSNNKVNYHTF